MQAVSEGELDAYKKAVIALSSVTVFLFGGCVKLAKFAWDERMARLTDHQAAQAQIKVAKTAAIAKGGSPE